MAHLDGTHDGSIGSAIDALVTLSGPFVAPVAAAVLIDDHMTQQFSIGFTHAMRDKSSESTASMMVVTARMMLKQANEVLGYPELLFADRTLEQVSKRAAQEHPCKCENCNARPAEPTT